MNGTVYSGINNIYHIRDDKGLDFECRIKGKILKTDIDSYNPLAPGDRVEFEATDQGRGLILDRLDRRNRFARWNKKRESWQTVAANLDLLLAVISAANPPFRPRFVDRVLIAAGQGKVPAAILVNKVDQGLEQWIVDRIDAWKALGVKVYLTSAETGEGLDILKDAVSTGTAALFGPSGVGKSTLLNRLIPGIELATGGISQKYDRGRHVTNFGRLLDTPWGGHLVDTPGVREILVRGVTPGELHGLFPEFAAVSGGCSFSPCSHRHEPECGVREAAADGRIHEDRYENYLRILWELEDERRW